jgi:ribosomal protein S18 acetylase RimI-like enzyme
VHDPRLRRSPPVEPRRRRDDRRVLVRPVDHSDQAWKVSTLERGWGSTTVARLGELIDAATLPGFVAIDGEERVGLVTYAPRRDELEVVTIQSLRPGLGVGRSLMEAVRDEAARRAARRIWLITTNDNIRALAFYQRWGMNICRFVRNGVDISRVVKPSIPTIGSDGIPLRHEMELELLLG